MAKLDKEIARLMQKLPELQHERLLEFARRLAGFKPSGVHGSKLLRFAGRIPPDDLQQMSEAIDLGSEAGIRVTRADEILSRIKPACCPGLFDLPNGKKIQGREDVIVATPRHEPLI